MTALSTDPRTGDRPAIVVDAVVIGAGFSGLRVLHELRELGLSVKVLESAPDVGGTWYWNNYPGARTDSEYNVYAYFFSRKLQERWDWNERFPTQSQVHDYLRYVAEEFDLRKDVQLNTTVTSASFDETTARWTVVTEEGDQYRCKYFIPAVGLLSAPYVPDFEGIGDFAGEWYVTGRWPKEKVDFTGKRVAVIGTGASGIQAIPLIAKTCGELTVFQRTPNYVLPARNYTTSEYEREAVRAAYDDILHKAWRHPYGYYMKRSGRTIDDVTPEEHQRILEAGWEAGGFRFLFETFDDISSDERSNAVAAEFVRNKIRTIVEDPVTAELLCPKDYPIGAKRPPLGHFYYETFNLPHVHLVDVSSTPITRITPSGIQVGDHEYPVDIIVFATGFDAGTGALAKIDVRGRQGVTLAQRWADGPHTYLGIAVDAFPNMFIVAGPQSPIGNAPVVIELTVEWIGAAIRHLERNGIDVIEARPEAVADWGARLEKIVNSTLLPKGRNSWFLGDNIPGKKHVVLFYFGGVGGYRQACADSAENGYAGFSLGRCDATG